MADCKTCGRTITSPYKAWGKRLRALRAATECNDCRERRTQTGHHHPDHDKRYCYQCPAK